MFVQYFKYFFPWFQFVKYKRVQNGSSKKYLAINRQKSYAVIFPIDVLYFFVSFICKTLLITLATSLHNCDNEGQTTFGLYSGFLYVFVYLVLITVMKAKTLWIYYVRKWIRISPGPFWVCFLFIVQFCFPSASCQLEIQVGKKGGKAESLFSTFLHDS